MSIAGYGRSDMNKKTIIFVSVGIVLMVLAAVITVVILNNVDTRQSSNEQTDTRQLTGPPAELRQKGLEYAASMDKDNALRYFNAAKEGFQKANDTAAVEEIDMQISQAREITPIQSNDKFMKETADIGQDSMTNQ
jgi:hypothetical protein